MIAMVTSLICRGGGRKNDLFTADIPESYDEACEHLRSDIMRARKLFPDTNALLTGPQHGVADDALGARSHQPGP